MFQLWMVVRYLKGGARFVTWTSLLAFLGMVIGVASLVATMAVVSGVETSLKNAIIDVTGHMMLWKKGGAIDPIDELIPKIKKAAPSFRQAAPFVHLEAVLAQKGKIAGIILQGVEAENIENVINIRKRVMHGQFDISVKDGLPQAVIGKNVAKKFQLKVGQSFYVVYPRPGRTDTSSFSPRRQKYRLSGIVDMGKFDFNDRLVIASAETAQKMLGVESYSGLRILLKSADDAADAAWKVASALDYPYATKDWYSVNYNLFSAIEIEKPVIFIVLLFMVLAGSYNISSALFVSVMKRFSDIGILRTMGGSRIFLAKLFVVQGMFVGFLGAVLGVLCGIGLCYLLQNTALAHVPGEIYKFDFLAIDVRFSDVIWVLLASLFICFISTLIPAWRATRLDPIEGLRYE
jgi:lipoprotein-releasing system permease protein